MADSKGQFVWFDLMTKDLDGAKAFYAGILNWETQKMDGDMDYMMWTHGGEPFGGLMDLPEEAAKMGAPPHWMAYIATPDVDATVAQAKEMGGQVYVDPTDLPEVGRFAILADPQGGSFAVFSADKGASGGEGAPGEFSWHELITSDMDAAWTFYEALFGWKKDKTMDMGDAGSYAMYGIDGGARLGGMMNKPADAPVTRWLYYIHVENLDAVLAEVTKRGGRIATGPMDIPGGDRVATCFDPQGAEFALYSPAS